MLELSLNILDLVQNSLSAKASLITIRLQETKEFFVLSIQDDGCGMSSEFVAKVTDPFTTTRTTRKVGFGLPFISQLCDMTQGAFAIRSTVGQGTYIEASLGLAHLDRPPLGDIVGTMMSLIIPNPTVDFLFTYQVGDAEYALDTREIKEVLDGMPLTDPDIIVWLKDNLVSGIKDLHGQA